MNPSIIAAPVILALGGTILIWWWTRRLSLSGVIRALVRFAGIPLFVVLVGVGTFLANRSSPAAAQEAAVVTPSETMNVQKGTLTVTLNATGSLTPADEEVLTFDVSVPITDVMVSVGDHVQAGDVLARVDSTSIDAQIHSLQLNLEGAQNSLAALQEPPSEIEIELAQAQVQAAQASLSVASLNGPSAQDIEIARLNVELAKNSLWQAQVSRDAAENKPFAGQENNAYANDVQQAAQLQQSDTNISIAQNNYESTANEGPNASGLASGNASLISAQANLDSLMAGADEAQLRKAEISVETAQLALDSAKKTLDETTLTAPFDGIVASVDFVKGTLPGSITLIDTSSYTIMLSVDEQDITQLQVGQAVSLEVEALDNVKIPGTVSHIDPAPVSSESGQLVTYNVEVTLNSTDQLLRPGMSTVATVTLNQINDVIVVPNRFITVDATTQQATVKIETAPGKFEDIPVILGTRTDSESEVVSGLEVGQTLVILPSTSETTTRTGFGLFPGGGGGSFPAGGGGNFSGSRNGGG
jgi:HlyD family secretion protein